MTKQFCDVCGEQIYGDNKFPIYINNSKPQDYDLCDKCRKEFKDQRIEADIETFRKLRK